MTDLYLDFETCSELALTGPTGVGAHAYAEHPSTRVHCLGWAVDDGPVSIWRPGTDDDRSWEQMMLREDVTCVASNCEFERAIFRHKLGIETPIRRWDDPSAMAARCALPRALEDAAAALKLSVQKDMEGHRIMMKLAKPRRQTKNNKEKWWTPESAPDDFARLYSYCRDDVAAMRLAHQKLPRLSPNERKIFELTIESNERGVEVDVRSLAPAQALFDRVSEKLVAEFTALTGANPNSSVKAAEALGLPDFTEDTVRRTLLREDISSTVRRALEIRQLQAYSSLKKLEAFRVRTSGDGRLRGSMIYAGAERTTRWSAGGIQIQNFPSNVAKDMESAFAALHADCLDLLAGDDVLGVLSGMLRGFFVGPFIVGDFRQVEPRVESWLAKQFDMMNDFAAGKDLYKSMAATIHGVPLEAVTKAQRGIGKRAILGCGYGMGPDKFKFQMEAMHGVKITDDLAQRAVRAYRTEYSRIPKLWRTLEEGMETAIRNKCRRIQAGPVEMGMTEIAGEPFAYIRLPSGRAIFYGWPAVHDGEITYFGRDNYSPGKHWGRVGTWGGKLTENVVQAVCRDLLAHVVINMDAAGIPMAFTAHDELVSIGTDAKRFEEVFRQKPEWARTLALDVEVFTTARYRK